MTYKIEEYKGIRRIVDIDEQEFNLDKTLDCGQAFRWTKNRGNFWSGVIDRQLVILQQAEFKDGKQGLATNLPIDEIPNLINYLNLDMNYNKEISKLQLDDYAEHCYECSKGIHILRQDLFETMITFLMSQFNSMRNIRNIVNKLSIRYGEPVQEDWFNYKLTDYTFPTLERLDDCTKQDFLDCSIGLRADYLLQMIQTLKNNPDILNKIKQSTYTESIRLLKTFNGIGDKVANCISLFSLHHIEAFPIDVHIKRIINREYNGKLDVNKYKNMAGIIQQYMFYTEAFNRS